MKERYINTYIVFVVIVFSLAAESSKWLMKCSCHTHCSTCLLTRCMLALLSLLLFFAPESIRWLMKCSFLTPWSPCLPTGCMLPLSQSHTDNMRWHTLLQSQSRLYQKGKNEEKIDNRLTRKPRMGKATTSTIIYLCSCCRIKKVMSEVQLSYSLLIMLAENAVTNTSIISKF